MAPFSPLTLRSKTAGPLKSVFPPEVWIAAEIALKKAYLKPEPRPHGQMPKPGFGMDPFPGQPELPSDSDSKCSALGEGGGWW